MDMKALEALLKGTSGQGSNGEGWDGGMVYEPRLSEAGLEAKAALQRKHAAEKVARKGAEKPVTGVEAAAGLASTVHYWTDYCKAQFHSRSHVEMTARMPRFDLFALGKEAMREADKGEELLDQVRWFCEECDSLQGFVLPSDIDSGFGS